MAAEITTLTIIGNQATNLYFGGDKTTVSVTKDITIFNATSATISVPSDIQLSNSTPSEITSEAGSAGIANAAARSDHVHSAGNLVLNGGNF